MNFSSKRSLPVVRRVRGYKIERAPLGAYLRAINALQDFPAQLLDKLYPGKGLAEILAEFSAMDGKGLARMLPNVLTIIPDAVIRLTSELTGIEEIKLLNDPEIGADGLLEMLEAWIEVNGIENFTMATSRLWQKVKALAAKSGSNA